MGIGPSTKETSKHLFKDPLIDTLANDPDIDFQGVVIVGTPQANDQKILVGNRVAALLSGMRTNGMILTSDGWGNSDVDFANILQKVADKKISVSGLKFIGKQAKFVVENEYTKGVFDMNKSDEGIETQIVGHNNASKKDAVKLLASIKIKMRNARNGETSV
ncbi:MAG: glycine/sarcosine/betaine reductase component B subunit [Streptococcaceae bacterium]|jgi:D-proline reductase (dithiol) PrdE|nr:glycine/sarcosine/betaine reductase component B subunit [Streptococcaceae bacterium]